jgi:NAD-dependent oxidoreductase involved in siderophore biosynthesis
LRALLRLKTGDVEGGQAILSEAVNHIESLSLANRSSVLNQEALSLAKAALAGLAAQQKVAQEALATAKAALAGLEALQLKLALPAMEPRHEMPQHQRLAVYLFQAIFVLDVAVYAWDRIVRPVLAQAS